MPFEILTRREFITLLGAAAIWPFGTRAQQPTKPVIGFLGSASAVEWTQFTAAFRQGLAQTGFLEARTQRSNTVGLMVNTSDYRSLPPI
jgi:hypothetical protein